MTALTCNDVLSALRKLGEQERLHQLPRASNYKLQNRIIFCVGDALAVVRAWGYVYCMDQRFIGVHRRYGWRTWGDKGIHAWVEEQLIEQGV